jgi:hypothetical protein
MKPKNSSHPYSGINIKIIKQLASASRSVRECFADRAAKMEHPEGNKTTHLKGALFLIFNF